MAVEIRELVIKAVIVEEKANTEPAERVLEADREALIQECVDQVLKILKRSQNR